MAVGRTQRPLREVPVAANDELAVEAVVVVAEAGDFGVGVVLLDTIH